MAQFDQMNFADMATNAFERGRAFARQRGVENALSKYGTDNQGAENELIRHGAFDEANVLRQRRMQDEQVARRQGYAQKAQAGTPDAYDSISREALLNGDMDSAEAFGKLGERERAKAIQIYGTTAQVADRLKQLIPEDSQNPAASSEKRKALAMQQASAYSQATGVPEDVVLQRISQMNFSDASIDAMHTRAQAMGLLPKPIAVSPGTQFRDPVTHEVLYEGAKRAPSGYEYDENGDLQAIEGGPADPSVAAALAASRRKPGGGGSGGGKVKLGAKAIPLGPELDPNEWE